MSRASDLFKKIELKGVEAINEMIADYEPESMFLDFKQAERQGNLNKLGNSDNSNLSKCISGFANSEGGLVVWGVDSRQDSTTGKEITSPAPIVDANAFRARLESAVSRATIPPHPEVRFLHVLEKAGEVSGFVAMLVPKSTFGPVRDKEIKNYRIRTGSAFEIIPHDVLAGMFGRPPRPELAPNFIFRGANINPKGLLELQFQIAVLNCGTVIADRAYVSVQYRDLPNAYIREAGGLGCETYRGGLPAFSAVAGSNASLVPFAVREVVQTTILLPLDYSNGIQLDIVVGAAGSVPISFSMHCTWDVLAQAIADLKIGKPVHQDLIWKLTPPLDQLRSSLS